MTLLKAHMPSEKKKPVDCTVIDCMRAYNSFQSFVFGNKQVVGSLGCWMLPEGCGKGFTGNQYKIPFQSEGKTKYFKPKRHRMWFYCSEEVMGLAEDHANYTVSHLCHNDECINPEHLVLESLATNKSRNACPFVGCTHLPKCIRVGSEYFGHTDVVVWASDKQEMIVISSAAFEPMIEDLDTGTQVSPDNNNNSGAS